MTSKETEKYWTSRYLEQKTGWDIGNASKPLCHYIDQLQNKELSILVPGGGNAYEAEYLFKNGFLNTHVLDISEVPLQNFKARNPDFPEHQIFCEDFFDHQKSYDLILEQTFFCALPPSLRESYVEKMAALLLPKGKLVGLLFNFPLTEEGPPFGGDTESYKKYFDPFFNIITLSPSYNSIKPRSGKELFIIFEKK